MSNFKLTFTLKQHTPLIHFQADQPGATLRASELKPKFDRFLKKYVFNNEVPMKYKISKSKDALDYKIKVTSQVAKTYIPKRDRSNPNVKKGSYFGDNLAIELKNIEIEFFSFNSKLLSKIKEYFVDFMLITNFGTRQNKGFGSFTVETINDNKIYINIEEKLKKYFPIFYKKESYSYPLEQILRDYQFLKSGINKPTYKKSLLFEYMCDRNIRWEKRMIKERLKDDFLDIFEELKYEHSPVECQNGQNFEYKYIRGLLGVASHIEFLKTNPKNNKDKIKILIEEENGKIERFKSPLTFKVIDKNIYVLVEDEHLDDVKGKSFIFKLNEDDVLDSIEIPRKFNIFDFLNNKLVKRLKYQKVSSLRTRL